MCAAINGATVGVMSIADDVLGINLGDIVAVSQNRYAYDICVPTTDAELIENAGRISIESLAGDAYGIYAKWTINNTNKITANSNTGNTYGIFTDNGSINDSGTIEINSTKVYLVKY